jgi:murein DD-endopeptidase MepM/ murein hydrolase activator NlpD
MHLDFYKNNFPIHIPVASNNVLWNGRPDEFSNLTGRMAYSQEFGMTVYAKTGVYGQLNGQLRPHNGHDFAGPSGTPLVAPCRCWCSYTGFDKTGYGNFVFVETETVKLNGESIKIEFVLAHMEKIEAKYGKWYNPGEILGYMGSTGMSTGSHVHFGGRPLILKNNQWVWAVDDQPARGYIDLTDFFITKPIYNKQILLNERMKLIKKKGESNVYAISPKGKACLLINWLTFQRGLEQGMWTDQIEEVNVLPELGDIIVLTPDN